MISAKGALYGVSSEGATPKQAGLVFSVTPPASPGMPWKEATVCDFQELAGGVGPRTAISSRGLLYGSTTTGGTYGYGVVFSLSPPSSPGETWTEAAIYSFTESNGAYAGTRWSESTVAHGD